MPLFLCTLLPLFVPKHLQRNADAVRQEFNWEFLGIAGECELDSDRRRDSDASLDPDASLGSRVTRHADYYVQQRKFDPPPVYDNSLKNWLSDRDEIVEWSNLLIILQNRHTQIIFIYYSL